MLSIAGCIASVNAETLVPRQLDAFNSVTLNGKGIVHIHQGPQSIELKGTKASLEAFETSVKNKTLIMGFGISAYLHPFRKYEPVEINISMPEIKNIILNGNGIVKTDEFVFDCLSIVLNGNGVIETAGTASSLILNCTGNAKFGGFALSAQKVNAKLTGNVKIEIAAEEKITAALTGSGKIVYRGSPIIDEKISGSGRIVKDTE